MNARDYKHPPVESAFGVRVGDVIKHPSYPHGTVKMIRTNYGTGSGIRAYLDWDEEDNKKRPYPMLQKSGWIDAERIAQSIVVRAEGDRVDGRPDGSEAPPTRPLDDWDRMAEAIDHIRSEQRNTQRRIAAMEDMILMAADRIRRNRRSC